MSEYQCVESIVYVRCQITEDQYREMHRLRGEANPGRFKPWTDLFTLELEPDQSPESLLTYLREQKLPHSHEVLLRWQP